MGWPLWRRDPGDLKEEVVRPSGGTGEIEGWRAFAIESRPAVQNLKGSQMQGVLRK